MMPQRKRRSNRLIDLELAAERSEARERLLNRPVVLVMYGQESLMWKESLQRSVSLRLALRMVADGEAERITVDDPDNGRVFYFRELKPVKGAQYSLPSMLNKASMDAVAVNEPGAKLTRSERMHVERVIMFPFVGDTKSPLPGFRVTERDRDAARRLCSVRSARRTDVRVERYETPIAA